MPEVDPSSSPNVTNVSGGVNISGTTSVGGDVVGRDKITTIGYTVQQVSHLLTQISSTFQPKTFDGRCPYLGLDAFSEEDADRFFGRETLVSELVTRVKESRCMVIAGPSGCGKSSLVRAGLIHALKQGALTNSDRWLYATLTPGRNPIESLALAMSRLAKSPYAGKYLREHSAEPNALHEFADSQLSDRKDQRAIVFVDQFEEVFTQVSKEDERLAFLNLLTHAATIEGGRVTVLFALRSDFVSNCATYPQLNALLNQQFMQVGAMQPDELVSAIARPALQVGLRIDPDLVAQIVNDMQYEPGALPLMQFALKDLFDAQQAKGGVIALTLEDYLARGGLRKALERYADTAFAQLSENEQHLARTIFSGLIEIGPGTQDTRRTATFDELMPANVDVAQIEAVVRKLANARLITTDERDHHETITIAHETLIEAWPWLRRLVNENRDAIALQNQILEDAQAWDEHQRDASYLYSGARLATVGEELAGQKIVLSELAQKYVETGIAAFEAARCRRRRVMQGIVTGLVIISLVFASLSAWAISSQQAAVAAQKISRSRELATIALGRIDHDPERGLLIAIEAGKAADTYESQDALRQLIVASRVKAVLRAHESRVWSAQFSPDGKRIVTVVDDGTARVSDAATGQAVTVLRGHEGPVNSAQFSPDGKQIVTASRDRTARVWDAATGQELTVLRGHEGPVNSAQFSPDGKQIITASQDKTVRVWDTATRKELAVLQRPESSDYGAQFSPDGKSIVTEGCDKFSADGICVDGTARVWDATTGKELVVLRGHEGSINSARFSPDGKQIVTASSDLTARIWEAATGQELAVLRGHVSLVITAQYSPDGGLIVTASNDGTARIWNVTTGKEVAVLSRHFYPVNSAQFSADGKQVVTAGSDYTARVWDTSTGEELAVLRGHTGSVNSAQFSLDGTLVVTTSQDGTVRVWDATVSKELAVLRGHEDRVYAAQFAPDSKQIVTAGGDMTARVWDVATGLELAVLRGHESSVYGAHFSPDGKKIVTFSWDGTARIWDAATGLQLIVLRGQWGLVSSAQYSPDGRLIASVDVDGTAHVWDAATEQEVTVLRGHEGPVNSVQFSPDGKQIVTAGDDWTARVWDTATGQNLVVLRGHQDPVVSVQYLPSGKQIVTAGNDGTIRVWEAATGKELAVLNENDGQINSMQCSPDGRQIVAVSGVGTARVWEIATGKELVMLGGHENLFHDAQYSPDGKLIVTADWDKTLRMWDATTGQEVVLLYRYEGEVWHVQFSPDGKYIVTIGGDSTPRIFVVHIEDLIALAQSRVTRELSCEERVQYLHEDIVCSTVTP
jgi:WD40 repeat protein